MSKYEVLIKLGNAYQIYAECDNYLDGCKRARELEHDYPSVKFKLVRELLVTKEKSKRKNEMTKQKYDQLFDLIIEMVNEEEPYADKVFNLIAAASEHSESAENALKELGAWLEE